MDVPRLFRAPVWDPQFPGRRMLPALEATLADLGIDLDAQENVHLDVEQRPLKTPRAFCAPIEIPDKVMLVIQPMGGPTTGARSSTRPATPSTSRTPRRDLSVEERRLGDNAVTEGWAMLLQHLTDEPAWLTRRLDFPRPDEFAAEGAVGLLYFVRRYCAKLLYELEFHAADDPTTMRDRYVEILGDALKIDPSPTDYLGDIDAGFYVTSYLRSWAFEAQLREHLREEFGNAWFAQREAGSLLRELWSLGQKPTAEELLEDVTGATLEMEAVADRIRETLRASSRAPPAAGGGWPPGPASFVAVPRARASSTRSTFVAGALHGREEGAHRRHLLALLLEEPVQELLADELAVLPRDADEALDLLRHLALLRERELDGRDEVVELGRGASTPGITTSSSASRRYWTSIIAWFRSSSAWR